MNIEVVINVLKHLLNLKNISPKANWFILKRYGTIIEYLVSHYFFKKINFFLIIRKKLKFLIPSYKKM